MKLMTVEVRIQKLYQCSIVDFFQNCIDRKMETHEIAEMIDCSVSNLRRIARKYQFTFHRPEPAKMLSQSKEFISQGLNVQNFLSRRWIDNVSFFN